MNLNREIVRLSVPAIVSNVTVPLLGLVDTAIAGHLGSGRYLAAMVLGSSMLNMVFWLFGFLRMGTSGLSAQAYGASDDRALREVFTRSFLLACLAGVLTLACSRPLCALLLRVLAPESDCAAEAAGYYMTCVWGAPALLATMSVSGWLLGMQNTFWPMVIAISVNVINILTSVLLVYGFGFGFEGVALGTACANWAGLLLALVIARRFRRGAPLWCAPGAVFRGGMLWRFFRINTDIFFRSACVMAVSLGVTAFGARLGDTTLAANGVMMQFFVLFSYFMDGFAFTGEALCGRFAGAGDALMLRRAVRALLLWSAGTAVFFTLLYLFASRPIATLLTDAADVLAEVGRMRWWVVAIPPVTVAAFIFDGVFIGLTATRRMLAVTATAAAVFFGTCLLAPSLRGGTTDNALLWTAFLAYLFTRGALLAMLTPGLLRKHGPLIN